MPFIFRGATSVTGSSAVLEFEFTGGDSNYSDYRPLRLTISGTNYNNRVFDSDNKGSGSSYWTVRVSGLSPNTTYSVSAQLGYYTGSVVSWLDLYARGTFQTSSGAAESAFWSWELSNGSATDEQTRNAYAILLGERRADDFSHEVWNDLVEKIAETREARPDISVSWDNAYATKAATKAAAGDTLSAKRFNSIRYNINNMTGVGVDYVSSEDVILGENILKLVDKLNEVIGKLQGGSQ